MAGAHAAITVIAAAGTAAFTVCCILMMNSMFANRKAILVRARSPILAYLEGAAGLAIADIVLVDEVLKLEGRKLPCWMSAYLLYVCLSFASNKLLLRSVNDTYSSTYASYQLRELITFSAGSYFSQDSEGDRHDRQQTAQEVRLHHGLACAVVLLSAQPCWRHDHSVLALAQREVPALL
jgi:hypothetical protein